MTEWKMYEKKNKKGWKTQKENQKHKQSPTKTNAIENTVKNKKWLKEKPEKQVKPNESNSNSKYEKKREKQNKVYASFNL